MPKGRKKASLTLSLMEALNGLVGSICCHAGDYLDVIGSLVFFFLKKKLLEGNRGFGQVSVQVW